MAFWILHLSPAKRLGAGIDVQNAAWKETMQSRRAVGRMLVEMASNGQMNKGGRPKKNQSHDATGFPDLEDLGLTKSESSRSQAVFYIPEQTLANAIEAVEKNGGELVTRHFVEIGQRRGKPRTVRGFVFSRALFRHVVQQLREAENC